MKVVPGTTFYMDCGSGVAGDMILGALIGLGLSPKELETTLHRIIPAKGWTLRVRAVERRMWPAWSLRVQRDRPFTSTKRMLELIQRALMPEPVRKRAFGILSDLRWAERQAHGHDHGQFDPKGLGRIDTLVDVIGSSWGFWRLGIEHVVASPVNTGRIAPATAQLLARAKIPFFSDSPRQELATPTGVAILGRVAKRFSTLPAGLLQKAGFGAGTLERAGQPNVLAIYRARTSPKLLKYGLPNAYAYNA